MNPSYQQTPGGYPGNGPSYAPPPGSAGSHSSGLSFNPNVIPGASSSYPYTTPASTGTYMPQGQSSLHQPLFKTGAPTYSQAPTPAGAPPPYTPTPTYTYQPPHLGTPQYVTPQATYPSSMVQYTPQYSPSPVIHHTTVVQQPYESGMPGGMSASSALSMAAMQRPAPYPSPYHPPYQPRLGYHWWEYQGAGAKYYKEK
ncbi:myelin-associated neurite-outgrowth inhibitor-like isoform X2 [Ptychodera flava]|uniref:myelin-associated neurite-outgrowth inhibitor-like isoform X2 n=2 Tax=Ptychodera flava TaxID=63121 RepID=UPI00396A6E05